MKSILLSIALLTTAYEVKAVEPCITNVAIAPVGGGYFQSFTVNDNAQVTESIEGAQAAAYLSLDCGDGPAVGVFCPCSQSPRVCLIVSWMCRDGGSGHFVVTMPGGADYITIWIYETDCCAMEYCRPGDPRVCGIHGEP